MLQEVLVLCVAEVDTAKQYIDASIYRAIIIIIIFNYAVAVPIRVYIVGLYRYIIYIKGELYRAG
jgi:hypothetical protein